MTWQQWPSVSTNPDRFRPAQVFSSSRLWKLQIDILYFSKNPAYSTLKRQCHENGMALLPCEVFTLGLNSLLRTGYIFFEYSVKELWFSNWRPYYMNPVNWLTNLEEVLLGIIDSTHLPAVPATALHAWSCPDNGSNAQQTLATEFLGNSHKPNRKANSLCVFF